jgi:metal-responsive CopG/Arc/MetJ family transcriptional regulator
MKRATMTLPDDLARAVEEYRKSQDAPPALTSVVQAALRDYLTERGFLRQKKTFRIRPAARGSGRNDVSLDHDRYLTGIRK